MRRRRLVWVTCLSGALLAVAATILFGEAAIRRTRGPVALSPSEHAAFARLASSIETPSIPAAGGALLHALFVRTTRSSDCAVLLHGVSDTRRGALGLGQMMLENGYSALMPDSRAHGESGGNAVTFGLLERQDVLGWVHWLKQQGCRNVYGLGESMGASILIQAAAEAPAFSAIVAECPYSSFTAIAEDRVQQRLPLPGWITMPIAKALVPGAILYLRARYGFDLRNVSPEDSARRLKTPLLLIHGLDDTNLLPRHSERILAAAPGSTTRVWFVPGAIHTRAAAAAPAEFRRRVFDWFRSHSSPSLVEVKQ